MKSLILLLAMVISSVSFAADCGRVIGTPGFTFENFSKEAAREGALNKCEDYKLKTGLQEGVCSDMGCDSFEGGFSCAVEITVCQ